MSKRSALIPPRTQDLGPDRELVARLLASEDEAWEDFRQRFLPRIGACVRRAGVWANDIEDACSFVLIRQQPRVIFAGEDAIPHAAPVGPAVLEAEERALHAGLRERIILLRDPGGRPSEERGRNAETREAPDR